MSQGSINMPTPTKSPIEGIMQGLQAVQNYYGIDTEKQRQALQAMQIEGEKTKNEQAKLELGATKSIAEGNPNNLAYSNKGYTITPGTQNGSSQPDSGQSPTSFSDMMSGSNAVSSPTPTPIQRRTARSQGGGASPTNQLYPPVVSANGTQMQPGPDLMAKQASYDKTLTETQKARLEMANSATDETRKGSDQLQGLKTKFDAENKEAKDQLLGSRSISNALLSGNPISEQMAQSQLPMLALHVGRLSGTVMSEAESKDTLSAIKNMISQKSTGHMSPKEVSLVQNATRLMESSAAQQLGSQANEASQTAANSGVPKPADFIRDKILLPQGLNLQVPETAVKVHPQTGKAEIFKRSGKGWQLVPRSE